MNNKNQYSFKASIWQHPSPVGGWHFVSLPIELSSIIRKDSAWQEEGWGRRKAVAQIGKSIWTTAIWFDTKQNTYLLPIKAAIRKKEQLSVHDVIEVILFLETK